MGEAVALVVAKAAIELRSEDEQNENSTDEKNYFSLYRVVLRYMHKSAILQNRKAKNRYQIGARNIIG